MILFSRIRQQLTALYINAVGIRQPKLIKGQDSLNKLVNIIKEEGHKKVLLMTSAGFIRRGSLEPLFEQIKSQGMEHFIYSEVMPDPTVTCIEEAYKVYKDNNCDCIIAVGGGSVMDASKVVGARASNPTIQVRDMQGMFKIKNSLPDVYVIPTTAGTGSEATVAAVVTDEIDGKHIKYAVTDFGLVPKYAVIYPEITLSLPPHITAATGMDALTHAVETYTNRYASKRTKMYATYAVRTIFENLPVAYKDGSNIVARAKMLNASYCAGVAFTNNFVGYVHAVSHALGALYGIPHGQANAILLPAVMEQYGMFVYEPLSQLAEVVGITGTPHEDTAENFVEAVRDKAENHIEDVRSKAENFIEAIKQMNCDMNIPDKIKELKEEDFDLISSRVLAEANPAYPVPVIWNDEDVKLLLRRMLVREK